MGLYLTMDPRDVASSSIDSDVSTDSGTDVDMPPMIARTHPDMVSCLSRSRSNIFDNRPGEECLKAQREYRCHVRRRAKSAGGCQRGAKRLSVYSVSKCDDRGVAPHGRYGQVLLSRRVSRVSAELIHVRPSSVAIVG
jgi:hypothetical protein